MKRNTGYPLLCVSSLYIIFLQNINPFVQCISTIGLHLAYLQMEEDRRESPDSVGGTRSADPLYDPVFETMSELNEYLQDDSTSEESDDPSGVCVDTIHIPYILMACDTGLVPDVKIPTPNIAKVKAPVTKKELVDNHESRLGRKL